MLSLLIFHPEHESEEGYKVFQLNFSAHLSDCSRAPMSRNWVKSRNSEFFITSKFKFIYCDLWRKSLDFQLRAAAFNLEATVYYMLLSESSNLSKKTIILACNDPNVWSSSEAQSTELRFFVQTSDPTKHCFTYSNISDARR